MTPAQLLAKLSKEAELITAEIDKRQAALGKSISSAQLDLFSRVIEEILSELTFKDGLVQDSVKNYLLLLRLDKAFEVFQKDVMNPLTEHFVTDLFKVAEMTGAYYEGYAAEKIIQEIATSNELLRAALGIKENGDIIKGSIMYDISSVPTVRNELKMVVMQGIQSKLTLKDFTKTIKDFVIGKQGEAGAIEKAFKGKETGYAFDLFNRVAEIKNEEFREALDLQYFIYTGDVIKDSREFCIKKAGKVFAAIEADTEWPNDPDLIAKKSGIPYTPRIDRGRMNCRHRIRYISEELAEQLDPKKVEQIRQSYKVLNVE